MKKNANKSLLSIIGEIKKNTYDSVILVEGKRDKEALEKVGISPKDIIEISYKNQNQIYREIALYNKNNIIPLYDNDRTGENKLKRLVNFMGGLNINILLSYRDRLRKTGITYTEEIDDRLY